MTLHGYMYILGTYYYWIVKVRPCGDVFYVLRRFSMNRVNLSYDQIEWLYDESVRFERYLCDMGLVL